ncbi:hypothetical protein [Anaplasma bovis]|uniref:hypothetical protein n=1 Tax=Anaplasma bovis TaxID=186733 RepID=UPI002FEF9B27
MSLVGTKSIGNRSIQAYILSAAMAIIMESLHKKSRSLSMKNTLSICASFMAVVSFSAKLHENYVSDKIFVYFSPEDIKSVVTLFSPEISVIEAHPISKNAYDAHARNSHVMSIELTKQVVAPGNPKRAARNIKLRDYHYHYEDNPHKELTPQLVLKITGKKISNNIEVDFSHSKPIKKFILDVRSKKYTKYIPVPDANFIEKAISMHMEKRTFLSILLEKYTTQGHSCANAEKAIYLLSNFSHLMHKSVLVVLKQKIRKSLYSDIKLHPHDTAQLQVLLQYLDKNNTRLPAFTLGEAGHDSLKNDIASLLKQRASSYHVLHEILKQNGGSRRLAIQNEEIIACYADNSLSKTSTLLKRFILADNTLSARLTAIHGYIDAHKLCTQTNLECTMLESKFKEDSPENIYAHGALLECAQESAQNAPDGIINYSIASIIEHARKKVSQKYCARLSDSVTGLIDKACVRADQLEIKIEKSKTISYITEIEGISSPFSEYSQNR